MARCFVYFLKGIDAATASSLLMGVHQLMTEKSAATAASSKPSWDDMTIVMSSGGGDVIPAFGLYNEFMGLTVKLATHNAGAIDSAAILPFIAGKKRTASAASAFFFHQLQWTFPSKDQLTMGTISDSSTWLSRYEGLMAEAVASRTKLDKNKVLSLMRAGTSVDAAQAKEFGIIDGIEELSSSQTLRSYIA
ncbi:protein of unknown function [Hyphomicrobium sp. MC1]|nr:protein of unknown function [Hyphomicrobium sp. MC1]